MIYNKFCGCHRNMKRKQKTKKKLSLGVKVLLSQSYETHFLRFKPNVAPCCCYDNGGVLIHCSYISVRLNMFCVTFESTYGFCYSWYLLSVWLIFIIRWKLYNYNTCCFLWKWDIFTIFYEIWVMEILQLFLFVIWYQIEKLKKKNNISTSFADLIIIFRKVITLTINKL